MTQTLSLVCLVLFLISPAIATSQAPTGTTSSPQQPARSGPETADTAFIQRAAEGGAREIEAGKLALDKASSPDVKAFAKMMVDDHSKASAELMKLVSMVPPTPPQKPAASETLGGLSGEPFDRAYIAKMVTDHQEAVELFEGEVRNGKDDAVKKWASQQLPTIRGHLEKARALQKKTSSR